ncbi:MAG TPA: FAD-dependent oxidoreductase [Gemmatimonadaceae bacterium]|nr:FAD-dependent oxidoreductase [Gemmatimonadaceae bacterium]
MPDSRPPRTPHVSVSDRTTEGNRTGSWKYLHPEYHDRVAPCRERCPVGVDIEGYLSLLRAGRIDDACDLLLRENPIPAVTGRVCDHRCEGGCNRAQLDGAVAIHAIERALGDRVLDGPLPPPAERRHAESVAIVGSGPAGLACAYHLVRLGYGVTVFERDERPGGMLRQGIPAYRLPRPVLDREIERIEALGVVFHCNAEVGRAPSWPALVGAFDAVFVGIGAQRGRRLGVPGEALPGVRQGLEFLRAVNEGGHPDLGDDHRVLVVGGGNTAMDCARTALRLGGRGTTVTVVYRRTREEMPAIADEVADAEREGVRFCFLAAPEEIVATHGHLVVACGRMELGQKDASGRRRPIPSGEEPLLLEADTVLLAIGEEVSLDGLPLTPRTEGGIHANAWGATAETTDGRVGVAVFGGGDVTGDERTVAHALAAGKRAAIGIDRQFRARQGVMPPLEPEALRIGEQGAPSMTRWRGDDPIRRVAPLNEVVRPRDINLADFARAPRHRDRHAVSRRRSWSHAPDGFAEVNLGLAAEEALAEAARCFECGVCNECALCMLYCADVAISRDPAGRFAIDLDHCKGCGVCAAECPRGAIMMSLEVPS